MNVIGYGSLMNAESLSKTIPSRDVKLVTVPGYRRVFNLKTRLLKLYKVEERTNKVAVLNAIPDDGYSISAVMFEVDEEEMEKLKLRERIYYVKEVEVLDFTSEETLGKANLFIGKKMLHGERIVSDDYLPIPVYLEKCRSAAYEQGDKFGKAFDETTFMGDGRSVREYLHETI